MSQRYTEEELSALVGKFNLLMPSLFRWRIIRATKEQIDYFGATIASGQEFYKRDEAGEYADGIRLSKSSMAKLLDCIADNNPVFEAVAIKLKKLNEDRINDLAKLLGD